MALSENSAARMAWLLSRDTFAEFRKISLYSIHENDCHLQCLALRWDQLHYDVEDVASTKEFDDKLMGLAEVDTLFIFICAG
jgi:hypothetical protein